MKRAHQPSDQLEPATKRLHQGDDMSSPFTAVVGAWNDFWMEVLQFLTSWDLWKLSCVSKQLFALVWNLLIPNYENGLSFRAEEMDIENYVGRVNTLQKLNLDMHDIFMDTTDFSFLKNLTYLSSLSCSPNFPFESISHLNTLTRVSGGPFTSDGLKSLSLHCPNLKDLLVSERHKTDIGVLDLISDMHHLQFLSIRDAQSLPQGLSKLTALIGLQLTNRYTCKELTHMGLSELTNLTSLSLSPLPCLLDGLSALTKLARLKIELIDEIPSLDDALEHLTNLKDLWFRRVHGDALSLKLTCLHALTMDPGQVKWENESLNSLTRLSLLKSEYDEDELCGELFQNDLTNLKELKVFTNRFDVFYRLTNLGILDLDLTVPNYLEDEEPSSTKPPPFYFPLARLHTLRIDYGHSDPSNRMLSHMLILAPSLTSLDLANQYDSEAEAINRLTFLTGLKSLKLWDENFNEECLQTIPIFFTKLESLKFYAHVQFRLERIEESEAQRMLRPLFALSRLQHLVVTPDLVKQFWNEYHNYYHQKNQLDQKYFDQ